MENSLPVKQQYMDGTGRKASNRGYYGRIWLKSTLKEKLGGGGGVEEEQKRTKIV